MTVADAPSFVISQLTASGRGAFATLRAVGSVAQLTEVIDRHFLPANFQPFAEQRLTRVLFGRWGDNLNQQEGVAEEIVICRIDETTVDLHCHGGAAATQQIVDHFVRQGAIQQSWQQHLESSLGLFDTECLTAVTQATTAKTVSWLLTQQSGLLRKALTSLKPAGLTKNRIADEQQRQDLLQRIDSLLKWSRFGIHLARPWNVVLVGRPNVGKSSLLNALVGYSRSIVFDQPGTTRDYVTAQTAFEGWPLELTDTAGLRETESSLEKQGIERTYARAEAADLILLLIDQSQPATPEDHRLLATYPAAIVIAHKADLNPQYADLPPTAIHVSSVSNAGMETLAETIIAKLVPQLPGPTQAFPITGRQVDCLQSLRQACKEERWHDYLIAHQTLLG